MPWLSSLKMFLRSQHTTVNYKALPMRWMILGTVIAVLRSLSSCCSRVVNLLIGNVENCRQKTSTMNKSQKTGCEKAANDRKRANHWVNHCCLSS